jgi:hypothetical protein
VSERDERDAREGDLPLSPASQIGRLKQTGGTPESRRRAGPDAASDVEEWKAPQAEDEPVERAKESG